MKLENYDPAVHHLLAIPEVVDAGCVGDNAHYLLQAMNVKVAEPLELRPGVLRGVSATEAKGAALTLLRFLRDHLDAEQQDPVATLNWDLDGAISGAAWDLNCGEVELLTRLKVVLEHVCGQRA